MCVHRCVEGPYKREQNCPWREGVVPAPGWGKGIFKGLIGVCSGFLLLAPNSMCGPTPVLSRFILPPDTVAGRPHTGPIPSLVTTKGAIRPL